MSQIARVKQCRGSMGQKIQSCKHFLSSVPLIFLPALLADNNDLSLSLSLSLYLSLSLSPVAVKSFRLSLTKKQCAESTDAACMCISVSLLLSQRNATLHFSECVSVSVFFFSFIIFFY